MAILILGLILFFGIHLLPVLGGLRAPLVAALGARRYKGMFSLVAALGLVLIVLGYAHAPSAPRLFPPLPAALAVAPLAITISFVLLAAANLKTHLRHTLRHPMLLGVGLWAGVHLLASGELRATLLFGAFLAYVAVDLVSAIRRNASRQFVPAWPQDALAIAAGVALALVVMALHRPLFGVPAVRWGW